MRKILTCILCMLSITVGAQNARNILDATAAKIRQMGDVRATFVATVFNGTTEQGSTRGTILIQGEKMQIMADDVKIWYNGKTQWSLMTESGEVNVSTPTEREMSNMNPYSFLGFYKNGYKMKARQAKLRGIDTYEVHLVARNASNINQEIYVDVSKNDYTPLCIRVRQDNDWNRISIHSLQGNQHFTDSDFEFPKSEYPNVEIIDLR